MYELGRRTSFSFQLGPFLYSNINIRKVNKNRDKYIIDKKNKYKK
jgi:hypothetical protein